MTILSGVDVIVMTYKTGSARLVEVGRYYSESIFPRKDEGITINGVNGVVRRVDWNIDSREAIVEITEL